MKLYTEEQVRQMLSIYMANILLNVDGKMPTVDEILSYRTPIELPNDVEISYEAITWDVYNMTQIEAFKHGTKWMKEQILNQNK